MFTFKLMGVDLMRKQTKALAAAVASAEMQKQFYQIAQGMADDMTARAPRGPTGNLRRSIHAQQYTGAGVSIVAVDRRIAPHAGLVEFGTSKMSAQPFFRPVVDAAKGVKGIIEKQILKAAK